MEIKQIIKEMLSSGMPESEVLSNLTELGVPNAQKIIDEVKSSMQKPTPRVDATSVDASKPAFSSLAPNKSEPVKEEISGGLFGKPEETADEAFEESKAQPAPARESLFESAPGEQASNGFLDTDEPTGQKIDELIALTKSLLELNKKILDSNRELLLKMTK